MLKTRNIGAYRDLLVLFTKYGRKDFRLSLDPQDLIAKESEPSEIEPDVKARAEAFARALKEMGPTYVKFGQVLSTRPDIVPKEYIDALESLLRVPYFVSPGWLRIDPSFASLRGNARFGRLVAGK